MVFLIQQRVFSGPRVGSYNEFSGGFVKMGCIPSVKAAACNGSFKFPKQFCRLAIGTKGKLIVSSYI